MKVWTFDNWRCDLIGDGIDADDDGNPYLLGVTQPDPSRQGGESVFMVRWPTEKACTTFVVVIVISITTIMVAIVVVSRR